MTKTVLILGGTGRFGRHATDAFSARGWQVHQFDRKTQSLQAAATGMDVIVNGWNPPYPNWAKQIPQLTKQVINAAKSAGATVIVPGNVYVFGTAAPAIWGVKTRHGATNSLGLIRRKMEAEYRASGVRTILLRAGDFIDTQASGNWFDMMMIPKLGKGRFIYPGDPEIEHAWAWLPDLSKAAVELAEMGDDLPVFADIPFAGYTLTGHQLCSAISTCIGRSVTLKKMNWLPLQIVRPFWPLARYLLEMRYLWHKPHRIDGTQFSSLLPEFQMTPLQDALQLALQDYINPNQPVTRGSSVASA